VSIETAPPDVSRHAEFHMPQFATTVAYLGCCIAELCRVQVSAQEELRQVPCMDYEFSVALAPSSMLLPELEALLYVPKFLVLHAGLWRGTSGPFV
jgi:hypothetical protein